MALHVPVEMADGTRHDATIEEGEGPGKLILEILGERWRPKRRATPSGAVLTAGTHTPTEYWMVVGRAQGS